MRRLKHSHIGIRFPSGVVSAHVLSQCRPSGKGFFAFWVFALIRPLACVCSPMSCEAAGITKRLPAGGILARMRLFAGVDAKVDMQS